MYFASASAIDVPMRIDEAWHHRAARQVHHFRVSVHEALELLPGPHREDAFASDRQGLHLGLGVVHRENGSASVDAVRGELSAGRCVCGHVRNIT
ncbi:hypothetical protein POL68_22255 [Stigmatella sp. ncwal1]|uniref:Uncharacterized protein n=1 Tax=Stigmatella ashevillensis TaxID=2995309 RepID=A0ABT5DC01_9BACT|nr:hypothetical protein [Stigmatella ashevillena]MDC0711209.1 hypothetical protein [Stigmatella ashevillena]